MRDLRKDLEELNAHIVRGEIEEYDAWLEAISRAIEAEDKVATLTEENDLQRQAIQNLSAQVAELRDCLLSYPFKPHNPECGCPECQWLKKREKLLASSDPGEKIMAVVEAVKYALAQEIRPEGRLVIDWTGVSILKQALADLEGSL
jgi:hypothetical protein